YREIARAEHLSSRRPEDLHEAVPDSWAARDEEADDRRLVLQAFQALPERWQLALWRVEVDELSYAEVGDQLGLKATAVGMLVLRARTALREAWLIAHLSLREVSTECRAAREKLARYSLNRLPERSAQRVKQHLDVCENCRQGHRDLQGFALKVAGLLLIAGTAGSGLVAIGPGAAPAQAVAGVGARTAAVVGIRAAAVRAAHVAEGISMTAAVLVGAIALLAPALNPGPAAAETEAGPGIVLIAPDSVTERTPET